MTHDANDLSVAHARFARAALGIYLAAAAVAVALLVAVLTTDSAHEQSEAEEHVVTEAVVRTQYLAHHVGLLAGELRRLGLRSEVNLLDENLGPERSLLELSHDKSTFFNVGVAIVGPTGAVLWAEPQNFLAPGTRVGDSPWFAEARRSGQVVVTPASPHDDGAAVLYVVSPLARSGAFEGVLLGAVNLARPGVLSTETAGSTEISTIVAMRSGDLVYPATPPSFASNPAFLALFAGLPAGPVRRDVTLAGRPVVAAATPVAGTNLVLVSLADREELFAPIRLRTLLRLALGLGLALAPLVVLVALLRRSFAVFRRAEEEAVRAERLRLVGEAANLIAHEVKNGLNGLRMGFDLALRASSNPARRERVVDELRKELERLGEFTTELMLFSKGVVPRAAPIELGDFAAKVTSLARDAAAEQGSVIEVSSSEPVWLDADPRLVHVVVSNLVSNALDAVGAAGTREPRIDVTVRRRGDIAEIEVKDNGPGVAASVRPRLFEPFAAGKPSGVGIGLALSRKIARAHGGELELAGGGPGARFVLTLPGASEVPTQSSRPEPREEPS